MRAGSGNFEGENAMCTTIRHTSRSMLVLCMCTACASSGGGQADVRPEDARFVQVTSEPSSDFVFYLLRDSVPDRPGREARLEGQFRTPDPETGILPSYELQWWPPPR